MRWFRCGGRRVGAWLALSMAASAGAAAAQAPAEPARPQKSVYGKLESVDKSLNSVIMKSDEGERLAWRLDKAVIDQAARFKAGDPMIVIYRQLTPAEKRVTAVAFPGSASQPTYVNATGSRVVMRSAPAVDGACERPSAVPATETTLPADGLAEIAEGCWCCAPAGETCTPSNRTGLGRAILVYCFK
jgi:hypothetical protein